MLQDDPEACIGCAALSFDHEDQLEGSAFGYVALSFDHEDRLEGPPSLA